MGEELEFLGQSWEFSIHGRSGLKAARAHQFPHVVWGNLKKTH